MENVWNPLGRTFSESGDAAGLDFTARWYFQVPWDEVTPEWQTLLLSGGANTGFNRLVDQHLESLLPQVERVIIPGASHEMFLDDRAASAAAILDFFRRH